jgi:hypothetical protein
MTSNEFFHPPVISPLSDRTGLGGYDVRSHLRKALGLLLQASEYADDVGQDPWGMAVELPVLRAAELTNSDLRWLVAKGYIEHGVETTAPDDESRHFRRVPLLTFSDMTCIVLTRSGIAVARDTCCGKFMVAIAKPQVSTYDTLIPDVLPYLPKWDNQRRQLRVRAAIVKEFKLPSPNQVSILAAFEEESWPPRIDDPVSPTPNLDARRRLHDAIKGLNRNQKHDLVRFMGDGSGEGVRWEFSPHDSITPPSMLARMKAIVATK